MAIKMHGNTESISKEEKKALRKHKPFYDKILKILFILALISVLIGVFYTLSPVVGFIAGFFVMLLGVFLVLASVATVFIIWAAPGYRNLVSKTFDTGAKIFNNSIQFKDIVANPYPIIMGVCGAIIVAYLVTSIILFIKKGKEDIHNEHKRKMITAIAFTIIFIACFIASYLLLFKIK